MARQAWTIEYAVRRRLSPPRYRLRGSCGGCARCCDRPAVRVGRLTWYLRTLRVPLLWWHRVVNGWMLVHADARTRTFQFACTHLDPVTRRCDSYASRPFACRDYPRALLDQAWPELFPECGFRPVAKDGERLRAAIARADLPPEERARLQKGLFLE